MASLSWGETGLLFDISGEFKYTKNLNYVRQQIGSNIHIQILGYNITEITVDILPVPHRSEKEKQNGNHKNIIDFSDAQRYFDYVETTLKDFANWCYMTGKNGELFSDFGDMFDVVLSSVSRSETKRQPIPTLTVVFIVVSNDYKIHGTQIMDSVFQNLMDKLYRSQDEGDIHSNTYYSEVGDTEDGVKERANSVRKAENMIVGAE